MTYQDRYNTYDSDIQRCKHTHSSTCTHVYTCMHTPTYACGHSHSCTYSEPHAHMHGLCLSNSGLEHTSPKAPSGQYGHDRGSPVTACSASPTPGLPPGNLCASLGPLLCGSPPTCFPSPCRTRSSRRPLPCALCPAGAQQTGRWSRASEGGVGCKIFRWRLNALQISLPGRLLHLCAISTLGTRGVALTIEALCRGTTE